MRSCLALRGSLPAVVSDAEGKMPQTVLTLRHNVPAALPFRKQGYPRGAHLEQRRQRPGQPESPQGQGVGALLLVGGLSTGLICAEEQNDAPRRVGPAGRIT